MDSANYLKELGARIRARREELELSQADVAKDVGVTPGAVGQWEAGATKIEVVRLQALARSLRMTVAAIVGEEPVSAPAPSPADLRLECFLLLPKVQAHDLRTVLVLLESLTKKSANLDAKSSKKNSS